METMQSARTAPFRRRAPTGAVDAVSDPHDPVSRSGPVWALCAAALCVAGMLATWCVAELVPAMHLRDAVVLDDFTQLSRPRVDTLGNDLLHLLDPPLYTLWGIVLVAAALLRRRPRVALAVALVLATAPLAAETLKPLLAHAHDRVGWTLIGPASWPSGHATAAMTLVLCALLVTPRRLRPTVAALGSLFAVAVGFSLLILAWHMPSDVLGGYLLAALFASLALAALRAAERRWPTGAGRRRPPAHADARWRGEELLIPALVVSAVALTGATAALLRSGQVETFASEHQLLVVAATGIVALVVLISSALTVALRR